MGSEEKEVAFVKCHTTAGPFTMKFQKEWAPLGYERAVTLFERGYYDSAHFFRVVPNFLVQFGITYSDDHELRKFGRSTIPDDPKHDPTIPFDEGIISFAGSGKDSRTSQLFIAYAPSKSLGQAPWETPIGKVTEGMDYVHNFYAEYGDLPPWGKGPLQHKIQTEGKKYMDEEFPLADRFLKCKVERIVGGEEAANVEESSDKHEVTPEVKQPSVRAGADTVPERELQEEPKVMKLPRTKRTLPVPQSDYRAVFALVLVVLIFAVCIFGSSARRRDRAKSS